MNRDKRFRYTPAYCEENIWHLARDARFARRETLVVMISGKTPYRRLWKQRNAIDPSQPVLWDYHVILMSRQGSSTDDLGEDCIWWVWDLDTRLELPVRASNYFLETFPLFTADGGRDEVILRLIEAQEYIDGFCSDRSHMKLASGEWIAPPPDWPAIVAGGDSSLLDWLDIQQELPGCVIALETFMQEYLGIQQHNIDS